MKYPRYQKYRSSGVEWIGEVPEGWGIKPLGGLVRIVGGGTPNKARPDYWVGSIPWVSPKDFMSDWIDCAEDHISEEALRSSATKLIPRGAALVVVRSGILRRTIPVALNRVPVALNQDVKALIPTSSSASVDFLRWFIRGHEDVLLTTCRHQGATVESLEVFSLRKIPIPHPPPPEQAAISAFLDAKTAEIDALIAKKESLVQLLGEKRAALIAHAVTKGLDAKAPMKESGFPRLGAIPEDWKVTRLRFLAEIRQGVTKGRDLGGRATMKVPYLRVANVQDGYLDLSDVAEIEITPDELPRFSLRKGDILMNEGGDNDKLGRGAVWKGEISPCLHQNHVFAVHPADPTLSAWIGLFMQSMYAKYFFLSRSKQSTNLASISSSNLRELPVVLPPGEVRQRIERYVSESTNHIDDLASKVSLAIDRLREYRTALISAAVSGKIDVRNLTPIAPCQ